MIGYLQCQGCFGSRLKIGPRETQVQTVTISEVEGLPLIGHFADILGERVLFYRWNGDLRLRLGDEPSIPLAGGQVDWTCSGGKVQVVLKQESEVVVKRSYPLNSEIEKLADNPTPFIEAEDYDFFLFVRNVLSDPGRAKRIYTK